MSADLLDRQRAAYVELLLRLAQRNPSVRDGLYDRIERAIAARGQAVPHRRRARPWPPLARRGQS